MPEPYFVDWTGRPRKEIFPGVNIATATGEHLMLARVALDPNALVPEHRHPHEQFGLVLEGSVTFTVGGETRALAAGDYYAIPGDVAHSVLTGPAGAVCLDIFSPPREEYR